MQNKSYKTIRKQQFMTPKFSASADARYYQPEEDGAAGLPAQGASSKQLENLPLAAPAFAPSWEGLQK